MSLQKKKTLYKRKTDVGIKYGIDISIETLQTFFEEDCMNEDLKPCIDIESEWELIDSRGLDPDQPRFKFYQNKNYESLYRIIDFEKQEVTFTDAKRINVGIGILDINHALSLERKRKLLPILLKVLNEKKPITLPYVHEELKVYIEDLDEAVGFLYFMDNDEDKSLVPVKRFFKVHQAPSSTEFEEISYYNYNEIREKKDVDKA